MFVKYQIPDTSINIELSGPKIEVVTIGQGILTGDGGSPLSVSGLSDAGPTGAARTGGSEKNSVGNITLDLPKYATKKDREIKTVCRAI